MSGLHENTTPGGEAPVSAVSAALRVLQEYKGQLLGEILAADGAKLFCVDLVVMAAMHRSLALIDGFSSLVEQQNALAAIPLIRMQIDSIIR